MYFGPKGLKYETSFREERPCNKSKTNKFSSCNKPCNRPNKPSSWHPNNRLPNKFSRPSKNWSRFSSSCNKFKCLARPNDSNNSNRCNNSFNRPSNSFPKSKAKCNNTKLKTIFPSFFIHWPKGCPQDTLWPFVIRSF